MKKLLLIFAISFFTLSCSDDSDDGCTCYIYQERTREKIPTGETDCSYNGRYISEAIGTKYICN